MAVKNWILSKKIIKQFLIETEIKFKPIRKKYNLLRKKKTCFNCQTEKKIKKAIKKKKVQFFKNFN